MQEHLLWSEDYKIGIKDIDKQHRQLFDLYERLRQSLKFGLDNPIVGQTLKDLVEYSQKHFTEEEEFLLKIQFEEIEQHKKLHQELLDKMAHILTKLKNNEKFDALDLLAFLKHWIINHILTEDLKIREAYKKTVESATPIQTDL